MFRTSLIVVIFITAMGQTHAKDKINADRDDNKAKFAKCKKSTPISIAQINTWWQKDRAKRGANFKYVYIPTDLLANEAEANIARVALFKALNHVAISATEVYVGEDASDGHCALYVIDVTKYWGQDGDRKWNVIADPINQGRRPFSPASFGVAEAFDPTKPAPSDLAVYNIVNGNVYNELINTPSQEPQLRSALGITDDVKAWGIVNEAIVYGPRVFWLRTNPAGLKYWASGDNFDGQENAPNPYSPDEQPRFKQGRGGSQVDVWGTHASEAWAELPNGFVVYYIWGNAQQERSKAEFSFVEDPNNKYNRELQTGRCMTCHMQGAQAAPSDYDGQGAWASNALLTELYGQTRTRFNTAMRVIVEAVSTGPEQLNEGLINGTFKREPVNVMIERREGTGNGTVDVLFDTNQNG